MTPGLKLLAGQTGQAGRGYDHDKYRRLEPVVRGTQIWPAQHERYWAAASFAAVSASGSETSQTSGKKAHCRLPTTPSQRSVKPVSSILIRTQAPDSVDAIAKYSKEHRLKKAIVVSLAVATLGAGVALAGSAEAKYYNSYTSKSVCQTNGRLYIQANPYYGRYECRAGNPGWWQLHVFPAPGNPQ